MASDPSSRKTTSLLCLRPSAKNRHIRGSGGGHCKERKKKKTHTMHYTLGARSCFLCFRYRVTSRKVLLFRKKYISFCNSLELEEQYGTFLYDHNKRRGITGSRFGFFLTYRRGGDRRSLYKDRVNVGEKLLLDTGKVSKVTH